MTVLGDLNAKVHLFRGYPIKKRLIDCTFAFDEPFSGHSCENRLHFCISWALLIA